MANATKEYQVFYMWDGYNDGFRWWESRNPGDMWDLVSRADLPAKIEQCQKDGIKMTDHLPVPADECDCGCSEHYNG